MATAERPFEAETPDNRGGDQRLPQLMRVLRTTQLTCAGLAVAALAAGWLARDPAVVAFGTVFAVQVAAQSVALSLARRGRLVAALRSSSAASTVTMLAATGALPELYPVAAVTVVVLLWAVLPMSVRRVPSWLAAAGLGVVAAVVVLGVVGRRVFGTATSLQVDAVVPAAVVGVCALLVFVLLQFRRRFEEAFVRLKEANAALERRVAERTDELARSAETTERQREYLEALLRYSPVAIVAADPRSVVTRWNPAAEQLFGWTSAEAVGRLVDELLTDAPLRGEATAISERLFHGEELRAVTRRTRRDGSAVDVELLAGPVVVGGETVGVLGIYHDISELQRAREGAERADRAKSAFLATMSHEIRTPMNAVIGMTGLLLHTRLDVEQREYAETVRGSGEALLALIDDILDFSKIEAGHLDLERTPFDLRGCVESALDLASAAADRARDVDIAYEWAEATPETVVGDVTRLRQVLLNLLSNACKFTEAGEIVVTVGAAPHRDGHELRVAVRDTGIGIPADRLDGLFASFSQLDASTTRRYGGTGLGLAISRRLAELMDGSLTVESTVGVGTTFHLTVVVGATSALPPDPTRQADPADLRGRRLLVVDDNATNRRILATHAAAWGMRVSATGLPDEAAGWVARGRRFDLAVLDLQMPGTDGLALARRIRAEAPELPLVLWSSTGRREPGADGVGFAAFLAKPLKPSQLLDTLLTVLASDGPGEAASTPAAAEPEAPRPFVGLRVLVAEDNAVNRKLAVRMLERLGVDADVACDGAEAVAAVRRRGYDVVLMDVQMPELDGLEATRLIVAEHPGAERPVIVAMTANAMAGDRQACLDAGMDGYVAKPVRPEELAAALAAVRTVRTRPR